MTNERVERRLTAILAADVAGLQPAHGQPTKRARSLS